jgi:putative ABC transport system permease protein
LSDPNLEAAESAESIGRPTASTVDRRRLFSALIDCGVVALLAVSLVFAFTSANSVRSLSRAEVGGVGVDSVVISSIPPYANGLEYGLSTKSLTIADVVTLSTPGAVPAATAVAPVTLASTTIQYGARRDGTVAVGTTNAYLQPSGNTIASGRFISAADNQYRRPVVVIGASVERALFGNLNPIGQSVAIGRRNFQVIGVLASRGFAGTLDLDNVIVLPQATLAQTIPGDSGNTQILLGAKTPALAQQAAQQAFATLLTRHQIADPAEADFSVLSHSSFAGAQLVAFQTLKRVFALFSLVLFIAGAVQLGRIFNRGRRLGGDHARYEPVHIFDLARASLVGIVGGLVGLGIGVVTTPFLRVLAPGIQVTAGVGWFDAGGVVVLAIVMAIVSLFPAAVGFAKEPVTPVEHVSSE